jgi:hypothetical protein
VGWLVLAPAFLITTTAPHSARFSAFAIGVSQLLRICSALLFVWSAELYRQSSYLRGRWLKSLAAVSVLFIVAPLLLGAWTVVVPGYLVGAVLLLATAVMYAAVVVERRMIGAGLTALVMLGQPRRRPHHSAPRRRRGPQSGSGSTGMVETLTR